MARTKKRALWLRTEAAYGNDPDADGSDYRWVPTRDLGLLVDLKNPLETNYFTGRNFDTAPIPGPDGWSFDCKIPLWGLAAAAGDGISVGTDDVLDEILLHIFGTQANVVGEGVAAASTTTSLILDTSTGSLQDLVPIWEAGIPTGPNGGPRTQWAKKIVAAGAPTYTIAPTLTTAPTTAAVAYGVKHYRPDDDGGATLAFVYRKDDVDYTLLGGRCTKAIITWESGKEFFLELSFRGDSKTAEAKGSLPLVSAAPPSSVLRATSSPLWINNTVYKIQKGSLDLGVVAAELGATSGANGRGGDESVVMKPVLTVNPQSTDALENIKRDVTTGRVLLQIGAGVLSGGVLGTMAYEMEQFSMMAAPDEDENGRIRKSVSLKATDPVIFSGSTLAHVFQLARA